MCNLTADTKQEAHVCREWERMHDAIGRTLVEDLTSFCYLARATTNINKKEPVTENRFRIPTAT